jgi:SWI/SNF-related matrix-associated actin-dependent regulator 1 of chromatin subfamily A
MVERAVVRPFIRYDNDHLVIRAYKPDEPLPSLKHLPEPYSWTAPRSDEAWLRSLLKDADWPAPEPQQSVVGPDKYGSVTPRQFQFETRRFGDRVLLVDEPGLGKTIESLMFIMDRAVASVIITRASAKEQWAIEARKMGLEPVTWEASKYGPRLSGSLPTDWRKPLIIHYEQLPRLHRIYVETWLSDPNVRHGIVLDESHAVKNPEAGRTAKVFELFWKTPYKVLISATPIRNRTAELWPQLAFLDSERFGNWTDFALRYCAGEYVEHGNDGGHHLEAKGTSNWDELILRMAPFLLRRTYDEVKLQLPPISRMTLRVTMSSEFLRSSEHVFAADMKEWAHRVRAYGHGALDRKQILAAIQEYRMAASIEKAPEVAQWLRYRKRTLVVTSFARVAEAVQSQVPEALLLTGSVPPHRRPALLEEFHRSEVPLVATLETGGESLNLQTAHEVAFIDLPWTPAAIKQSEMRVWRQGQHDPVVVTYFVSRGTMEEKVAKMLLSKEIHNQMGGGDHADILSEIIGICSGRD